MVSNEFLSLFKAEAHIHSGISNDQLFNHLNLFTQDGKFKKGAVLFFAKQPETIIEKAIIRCLAFEGNDKRFIIDDKPFCGNLFQQYVQAIQWLKGKLNVRYDIEGQGAGPRKEIWEIPETVFKEAIINSLSHRDYYDKGAVTHIEVYSNRVEISNPGGLVSAIPPSEFGKRSHSRNPLIFGLFTRMHLVEQVGSGIGRMNELMKAAGLPKPLYQKEGLFTIILKRPVKIVAKTTRRMSEKMSEKTLRLITENNHITTGELSVLLNKTTRTIERQIKELKEQGYLQRIGPDKGGYWKIVKNESE